MTILIISLAHENLKRYTESTHKKLFALLIHGGASHRIFHLNLKTKLLGQVDFVMYAGYYAIYAPQCCKKCTLPCYALLVNKSPKPTTPQSLIAAATASTGLGAKMYKMETNLSPKSFPFAFFQEKEFCKS